MAAPPDAAAADTEWELGGSHDRLSNDFGTWRSVYLDALHTWGPNRKLNGSVRRTTRFGLSDVEVGLGGYYPLTDSLVGQVEARAASPGELLPERTLFVKGQQGLGGGWVMHGGYRRRRFTESEVNTFIVRGEVYFGQYRADLTLTRARLDTGETASGQGTSLSRFYGERNSLNLLMASGEEIERISDDRVARFDTFAAGFWGRHWFSQFWGVTYGVRYREQNELYHLTGVHGGLRRAF